MWTQTWQLLWLSAVIFTICSFIWRKHVLFALVAAVFWLAAGMGMQQLEFVGFGAQNINIYDHELGDWTGDIGVFYLFHGLGVVMLVYALYNGFLIAKGDLASIHQGGGYEQERL